MTVIDALTAGGRTWLIHQTYDAGTWIEPIRRVSDIDDEEN
jgi:hypothetical protein